MPIDLTLDGKVAVLTMNEGENRFNPPFLTEFLNKLDEVEKRADAGSLIVRSAHEKIFTNGIDLDWLLPLIQKNDKETVGAFIVQLMSLMRRILLFPLPTIAAITGHAFAGGAIMCCYFDYRFMRTERGFFCFPEVDLGIPFLPGMMAAIKKTVPRYKLEEMLCQGKRAAAEECEAHHIINKAYPVEKLMDEVVTFARGLNKQRKIMAAIKQGMNEEILHAMDVEDPIVIKSGRFYA